MRIQINLATQPYRDAGAFYSQWITAAAILGVIAIALAAAAAGHWRTNRTLKSELQKVTAQRAALEEEKRRGSDLLANMENRSTRDKIFFLNGVLAQKSLSWTQLFTDFEKLMPRRVHLQAIQPKLDKQNRLELRISVNGNSHDDVLEFVRRLEQSDHFRQPTIIFEKKPEAEGNGLNTNPGDSADKGITFEITTAYFPAGKGAPR